MIQIDSPVVELTISSLGWTLLHFLWQGAVVGVLFGISLALAARSGARARYHIGLFYMAVLAALPVVTFLWIKPDFDLAIAAESAAASLVVSGSALALDAGRDWRVLVQPYLPWTVFVWGAGVLFMTARLLLEWRAIRRLTRLDVEPLAAEWQARIARLRERLHVHQAVVVLCSARVQVPIVVGWLRPVILVPFSAFTGLTPWQLELILMHELAHVRRHDYLVNLLQVVVETLLFYHPVVRWVSRVVREEREHCCDDLVVARSGDPLSYARALTELAGAQSVGLQTSVGSDGGKLIVRIKRLVLAHEPRRVSTHWSVGAMLAAFGMSMSSLVQPGAQRIEEAAEAPLVAETMGAPTVAAVAPLVQTASIEFLQEIVQTARPMATRTPAQSPAIESIPETPATGSAAPAADKPAASAQAADARQPDPEPAEGQAASPAVAEQSPAASGSAPDTAIATEQAPAAAPMAASAVAAPAVAAKPAATPNAETSRAGSTAAAPVALDARPVYGKAPEFPVDARLDGVEGWVKFTYTIGKDGEVRNVRIVAAEPRNVFENAVRRAVRGWRFEPPTVEGRPVEREITQVIEFALGRAASDDEHCQTTGTRLCRKDD